MSNYPLSDDLLLASNTRRLNAAHNPRELPSSPEYLTLCPARARAKEYSNGQSLKRRKLLAASALLGFLSQQHLRDTTQVFTSSARAPIFMARLYDSSSKMTSSRMDSSADRLATTQSYFLQKDSSSAMCGSPAGRVGNWPLVMRARKMRSTSAAISRLNRQIREGDLGLLSSQLGSVSEDRALHVSSCTVRLNLPRAKEDIGVDFENDVVRRLQDKVTNVPLFVLHWWCIGHLFRVHAGSVCLRTSGRHL